MTTANRRRTWLSLAALAALSIGPGAGATGPAADLTATFVVEVLGSKVGVTRWTFYRPASGALVWESTNTTAGVARLVKKVKVSERSEWAPVDGTLRPARYHYERTGDKRARREDLVFDWDAGQVAIEADGASTVLPIAAPAFDPIGYMLALIRDVAAGDGHAVYQVANRKGIEEYRFDVIGEVEVAGDPRAFTARLVERNRDDERTTKIWMAGSLGFLPVRIEHRERDGWEMVMRLERLEGTLRIPARDGPDLVLGGTTVAPLPSPTDTAADTEP